MNINVVWIKIFVNICIFVSISIFSLYSIIFQQIKLFETNKIINILKQNEKMLTNECDLMLNNIKANLNPNKFEENCYLFQIDD